MDQASFVVYINLYCQAVGQPMPESVRYAPCNSMFNILKFKDVVEIRIRFPHFYFATSGCIYGWYAYTIAVK